MSIAAQGCAKNGNHANAVASRSPSPSASTALVIFDCLGKPASMPASIVFACGDGNAGLKQLVWHGWGASRATATGVRYQNDCEPNCAAGRFHEYPAMVVASAPGAVGGRNAYTMLEVTVSGPHPPQIHNPELYALKANGPYTVP